MIRFKSVLISAALAGGLAAAPVQAQDKVKMGLFIASSAMPYFIAVDRGYFKAENLEVEGVPLATHPLIIQANQSFYAELLGPTATPQTLTGALNIRIVLDGVEQRAAS